MESYNQVTLTVLYMMNNCQGKVQSRGGRGCSLAHYTTKAVSHSNLLALLLPSLEAQHCGHEVTERLVPQVSTNSI